MHNGQAQGGTADRGERAPENLQSGTPRLRRMFIQDGQNVTQMLELFMADMQEAGFRRAGLDNAFRAVHSLKSEAAFLDYHRIHDTAHEFESLLQELRARDLPEGAHLDEELLQIISDAVRALITVTQEKLMDLGAASRSALSDWGQSSGSSHAKTGVASLSVYDRAFQSLSETEIEVIREAVRRGEIPYVVQCSIADTEQLGLPRLYLIINNLETVCTVVRTIPDFNALDSGVDGVFKALITASGNEEAIYDALNVDQVESIELQPVDQEQLYGLQRKPATQTSVSLTDRGNISLDLSARRYATLSLYSDELFFQLREAIHLSGHDGSGSSGLRQALRAAETLASRVNDTLLDTSLVPLSTVLEPVHQMIADLCSAAGKHARLFVSGESERVFLPVADVVSEILLHLVRNSVDHGIEPPEERANVGKAVEARIEIRAQRRGDTLEIRFSDDGRGVDEQAVRERIEQSEHAAQHGYELEVDDDSKTEFSRTRADQIDVLEALVRPGFSTVEDAGPVSGRGVGLDAVHHAVETLLSGSLTLHNNPGAGVEFLLVLPGSTRLLTVLMFESGDTPIAVPACQVADTFPLDVQRIGTDANGEYFYRMSDGVVRLFVVGAATVPEKPSETGHTYGILLQVAERKGIILADRLVSEEVVVRHDGDRRRVYSKTLNRNVDLFIPVKI